MVVEHNRRSTWTRALGELSDAPCGARRQRTHHQHSAAPLATSKRNSWDKVVLAQAESHWVGRYDTTRSWGSTKSWTVWVRAKVGKDRVSIFVVWYDDMETRWCPYIPRHSVHLLYLCISVHLSLLLKDVLGCCDRACFEMHLETESEWTQRCTWRPGSSEFGDAFGHQVQVNSEMHLVAGSERVWRCIWTPRSSEYRERRRSRHEANLEMHLVTEIQRPQGCSWMPRSSEHRDTLGSHDWGCWEIHLEAMINQDRRSTWRG